MFISRILRLEFQVYRLPNRSITSRPWTLHQFHVQAQEQYPVSKLTLGQWTVDTEQLVKLLNTNSKCYYVKKLEVWRIRALQNFVSKITSWQCRRQRSFASPPLSLLHRWKVRQAFFGCDAKRWLTHVLFSARLPWLILALFHGIVTSVRTKEILLEFFEIFW